MKLLSPLKGVSLRLHFLLLVELPILIVSLALFAWGVDSLRGALRYQRLAGHWNRDDPSGYGFEYGTQTVVRTSTWTGTSPLKTIVPATQTGTIYSYAYGTESLAATSATSTLTERVTESTTTTGTSTGTFTSTLSRPIFPALFGTAYYSDVYASAGVKPSDLPRAGAAPSKRSSEDEVRPTTAPTTPSANAAKARSNESKRKRDASWVDGATYDSTHHGLYSLYDDGASEFKYLLGLLSGCLTLIILRILATATYLTVTALTTTTDETRRMKIANYTLGVVLGFANLTWPAFLSMGVIVWSRLGERRGVDSPSVIATIAFFALVELCTIVVSIWGYIDARRVEKRWKALKNSGEVSNKTVESQGSSVDQAA